MWVLLSAAVFEPRKHRDLRLRPLVFSDGGSPIDRVAAGPEFKHRSAVEAGETVGRLWAVQGAVGKLFPSVRLRLVPSSVSLPSRCRELGPPPSRAFGPTDTKA